MRRRDWFAILATAVEVAALLVMFAVFSVAVAVQVLS